jgi:uncharacterized protein YgiM (DUF1202 family)
MIGVSIASAIAVMVGAFAMIFAVLDPLVSDFVGPYGRPTEAAASEQFAALQAPGGAAGGEPAAPVPTAVPTVAPEPTEAPEPTAESTPEGAFEPDYRVTAQQRINFRSGPGVSFDPVVALDPGAELQSLGESRETTNPAADLLPPGREWLKFRLEDGREGWIREIDVAPMEP